MIFKEVLNLVYQKLLNEQESSNDLGGFWFLGPNPAVDMVVVKIDSYDLSPKVLLITRKPGTIEGGKLALPGGFINTSSVKGEPFKFGKEKPVDAAIRELEEETGLDTQSIKSLIKKVGEYNDRGRDPRNNKNAWAVSYAFAIKLPADYDDSVQGRDDASDADWYDVNTISPSMLAFDHGIILKDGLNKLKI